jgi:phage terminase large subunit
MPHYIEHLKAFRRRMGCMFGTHVFPHDVRVKEWGSSRTRIEQFVESDLDARSDARVAPRQTKDDAINAARQTLSVCWFDAAECDEGLKSLRSYRKEWDEEKGIWRDTPRHDKASHGADAFQTLSVWWREMRDDKPTETFADTQQRERDEAVQMIKEAIKPKTLNQMIEDYEYETAEDSAVYS